MAESLPSGHDLNWRVVRLCHYFLVPLNAGIHCTLADHILVSLTQCTTLLLLLLLLLATRVRDCSLMAWFNASLLPLDDDRVGVLGCGPYASDGRNWLFPRQLLQSRQPVLSEAGPPVGVEAGFLLPLVRSRLW